MLDYRVKHIQMTSYCIIKNNESQKDKNRYNHNNSLNKIKIISHFVKLTPYFNVKVNIQMISYCTINNNESQKD